MFILKVCYMNEDALNDILHDIHTTGFFSGLRKESNDFTEWSDSNKMLFFCLCATAVGERILESIYISGYSDGLRGVCNTCSLTWAEDNPGDYDKLVSLFCS